MSILLAFSINAWWESRKIEEQKIQLLNSLKSDFIETSSTLNDAIKIGKAIVKRAEGYLDVVREGRVISNDSLFFNFAAIGDVVFFQPTVASYRSAVNTFKMPHFFLFIFLNVK